MDEVIAKMYNMKKMQEYVDEKLGNTGDETIASQLEDINDSIEAINDNVLPIISFEQQTDLTRAVVRENTDKAIEIFNSNKPFIAELKLFDQMHYLYSNVIELNRSSNSPSIIIFYGEYNTTRIKLYILHTFGSGANRLAPYLETKTITFDS